MNLRRKILSAALLLAAAGGLAWWQPWDRNVDFQDRLRNLGLNSSFTAFSISTEKSMTVKGLPITDLTAIQESAEIHAVVIPGGASSFDHYTNQKLFQIQSLYSRGTSPYPGGVSQTIHCPEDLLPVTKKISGPGWEGQQLITFANSKKQMGVCLPAEKHYKVAVLILKCAASGTVYDLTVFDLPNENSAVDALTGVSCTKLAAVSRGR